MEQDKRISKHKVQIWAAMIVLVIGCLTIVSGLIMPPMGEIHPSVLIAFGECLTFVGAVLGAKYYTDFKSYIHDLMNDHNKNTKS